jgi:hypothetical protein
MERVISTRLKALCEERGVFSNCQSGFRTGRSTYDHLFRLTEHCLNVIKGRDSTLAVFLDIQKAFDSVWHDGIRYRLHEIDVPTRILRWTSSFLTSRTMRATIKGTTSGSFTPAAGVPQGSVISPLLYIIYVRDMIPPETVVMSPAQFADDTALWANKSRATTARDNLQSGLDHIYAWCMKWRLVINPGKTQLVRFGLQINPPADVVANPLRYGQTQLQLQPTAKFLGVKFDSKMTLGQHCRDLRKRAMGPALLLRAFHSASWSIPTRSLMIIYKTHILPIMTYGSIATITCGKTNLNQLQTVQNTALRRIYNFPNGVRSDLTHHLSGLDTVPNRLLYLARRYYNKVQNKDFVNHQKRLRRFRQHGRIHVTTPIDILDP